MLGTAAAIVRESCQPGCDTGTSRIMFTETAPGGCRLLQTGFLLHLSHRREQMFGRVEVVAEGGRHGVEMSEQ